MATNSEWMERKLKEQRRLYEKYGKPLEKKHKGEIILDKRLGELLKQATDTFGHDNFAMARVGHDAMAEWLHVG